MSPEPGRPVRQAGTGRLPGGRRLTWTIADGTRGRRWRTITTTADGRLLEALLLETTRAGAVAKLELATPAGLLTLHPEATGSMLHGNVVRPSGIDHVALPWSDEHILLAGASPVTGAVAATALTARVGIGEGTSVPAVDVGGRLVVRGATWRVARTGARRWRLLAADGGASLVVVLDDEGIPDGFDAAQTWPLELDTPAG